MLLSKDLREFVELLNSNRVEYLIVGALAVSWYGFPRFSADIDLLIGTNETNAERLLTTIRQFGFGSLQLAPSDFTSPGRVIQLGNEPNRIDLLTSISGVSFDDAWSNRVAGDLGGLPVNYIGRAELYRNKEATGRAKDQIDLEELRKLEHEN